MNPPCNIVIHLRYHQNIFHFSFTFLVIASETDCFRDVFIWQNLSFYLTLERKRPLNHFRWKGGFSQQKWYIYAWLLKLTWLAVAKCWSQNSRPLVDFSINFPANIKVASALFLQNGMTSLKVEVAGSVLLPQNGTTCRSTTHWLHSPSRWAFSDSPTWVETISDQGEEDSKSKTS